MHLHPDIDRPGGVSDAVHEEGARGGEAGEGGSVVPCKDTAGDGATG